MTGKRAEAPKPAPQPTNEEKLLTEIRDLMRKEKEQKDR
jgi:large-conductance mechanosensitive channel